MTPDQIDAELCGFQEQFDDPESEGSIRQKAANEIFTRVESKWGIDLSRASDADLVELVGVEAGATDAATIRPMLREYLMSKYNG